MATSQGLLRRPARLASLASDPSPRVGRVGGVQALPLGELLEEDLAHEVEGPEDLRVRQAVMHGDALPARQDDPLRADRLRISPLLLWHPTEFSRLRLQYNYDNTDTLVGGDAHTVWLGAEILYGEHGAHKY